MKSYELNYIERVNLDQVIIIIRLFLIYAFYNFCWNLE